MSAACPGTRLAPSYDPGGLDGPAARGRHRQARVRQDPPYVLVVDECAMTVTDEVRKIGTLEKSVQILDRGAAAIRNT